MSSRSFALVADVSSADSAAIEPVLRGLRDHPDVNGFHVAATLAGESARDLNRSLLSDLHRVERRTRLRSRLDTSWRHRALLRPRPERLATRVPL